MFCRQKYTCHPPPKKKNKELEYTMDSFLGLPKYVWEGIQCDIL